MPETQPKLYFGYGSNLWKEQMILRCPESKFKGIAQLTRWTWIINDRGYANVVETRDGDDEVWGLVYSLSKADEARLDRNEGVPFAYTKEMQKINFRPVEVIDHEPEWKSVEMLVYVDRERTAPSKPKEEYIHRMNMGIRDAIDAGVPKAYIHNVLRKFIPPEGVSQNKQKLAQQQALEFNDDNDSA
jgi:gamma-glutamylcyclotransferase